MLKKRIIGIFLIFVFAIPVIPVMQVGSLLYQNQLPEEFAGHSTSIAKQCGETEHYISHIILPLSVLTPGSAKTLAVDERFVSRQADDIQTPPPNA